MAFQFPNVFDLRVTFNAGGLIWTNNYECLDLSGTDTPPASNNDIVNRLTTFVENNVAQAATVVQIACYNHRYGPGKLPLAAEGPIWILPINQPGNRENTYGIQGGVNDQYLDARAAAYVKKLTNGRVGKLFLHNVMMEGDVTTGAAGQRWSFIAGANQFNPTAFQAQVTGFLSSHLTSGTATDYKYCVPHVKTIPGTPPTYQTKVTTVDNFVLTSGTWHRGIGG